MDYSLVSSDNAADHRLDVETRNDIKTKSKLKTYLPILVPCLLAIFILSILAGVWHSQLKACKKFCDTTECVITSGEILKMTNMSVDPCTDFHEFTCGRFNSSALLKPESGLLLSYSELFEENFLKMYKLLTDKSVLLGGQNSSAVSKVKRLFSSCVRTEEIEKRGEKPLLEFIEKIKGWPLLQNEGWNESSWSLSEAIVQANMVGISPFFEYSILPNFLNSSEFEIKFMGVELSYGNKNVYNKSGNEGLFYKSILVRYVSEVARLLGATQNVSEEAEKIWQLEQKLANEDLLSTPETTKKQITETNRTTVGEINKLLGHKINLSEILSAVMGRNVTSSEMVTAASSHYFERVAEFIGETDKRTQANYITWLTIKKLIPYSTEALRGAERTFDKSLTGQTAAAPRWKTCVHRVIDSMGFALSGLFIEHYFEETAKHQVEEIFELIKSTFKRRLSSADWLDDQTRWEAQEKLRKLEKKIGYPDFIKDARRLDGYYEELTVQDDYFQNALDIAAFDVYKQNSIYGKPRSKQEWLIPPVDFNAYYDRTSNTMVLLAGLLQRPLFSEVFPSSYNFGRVGFIVGHEIIHGFDSLGRLFNSDGILVNWWSKKAESEFHKRAECFVKQYSSFRVFGRNTSGQQTLSEDIADNGGLSLAYFAYKEWLKGHKDLLLPGLNLSHEQQFFVAFGQYFCTHYRKEKALELLETDSHSNNAIRLIGTLQNSKEFAEAFKCPRHSQMNPSNKCSIW